MTADTPPPRRKRPTPDDRILSEDVVDGPLPEPQDLEWSHALTGSPAPGPTDHQGDRWRA